MLSCLQEALRVIMSTDYMKKVLITVVYPASEWVLLNELLECGFLISVVFIINVFIAQ